MVTCGEPWSQRRRPPDDVKLKDHARDGIKAISLLKTFSTRYFQNNQMRVKYYKDETGIRVIECAILSCVRYSCAGYGECRKSQPSAAEAQLVVKLSQVVPA